MESKFPISKQASCSYLTEQQLPESHSHKKVQKSEKSVKKTKGVWKIFNVFAKLKHINKSKLKSAKSITNLSSENDQVNNLSNSNKLHQETSSSKPIVDKSSIQALDVTSPAVKNKSNDLEKSGCIADKTHSEILMDTPLTEICKENNNPEELCMNDPPKSSESIETSLTNSDQLNAIEDSCFHLVLKSNYGFLHTPINTPKKIHNKIGVPSEECEDAKHKINYDEIIAVDDSTLDLLETVRSKLKCYLDEPCIKEEHGMLESKKSVELVASDNNESPTEKIEVRKISLNTIQNLYFNQSSIQGHSENEIKSFAGLTDRNSCTVNGKAYSVIESDIKTMIQELLNASNDIKAEIISNGITEDTPPFTWDDVPENTDTFEICSNVFNDILKATYEKHKSLHKAKQLNVTFKEDIEANENVKSVINDMLENIENNRGESNVNLCANSLIINYCVITDNIMRNRNILSDIKYQRMITLNNLNDLKLFQLTNAFLNSDRKDKSGLVLKSPTVTINNFSPQKIKSAGKLVNRIKRSSALLLALYDEMRDYSYYACTNLLNDLYEKMSRNNKQINYTNPIEIKKTKVDENPEKEEKCNENTEICFPGPSSNSSLNKLNTCFSNDSVYSQSDDEEIDTTDILSNIRYVHVSEEEINTPEEITKIENNVFENDALSKFEPNTMD